MRYKFFTVIFSALQEYVPATKMSTVVTIFDRCLKIKEQLRLKYIVCVFDQAVCCKKWRYQDRYNDYVKMLGNFHMIMMYLGIIGKKNSEAGLRDLIVQRDVLAIGSVDIRYKFYPI